MAAAAALLCQPHTRYSRSMSVRHRWEVEIPDGVDPLAVQAALDKAFGGSIPVSQIDREAEFMREAARRVRDRGVTRVLKAGPLNEAVLSRGESASVLATVVNQMLKQQATAPREIVICDPYFFPRGADVGYPAVVDDIWAGLVEHATRVVVVTMTRHDSSVRGLIEAKAKARSPSVVFDHRPHDGYHDRFWLLDRAAGVLVGTSANSLGRKYALADYLDAGDVADLVAALVADRLL